MTRNQRQEALSRAYVQAVAASASFSHTPRANDYGIDLSLYAVARRDGRYVETGIVLDVQVKSTTRAGREPDAIVYDLDVRAYDTCATRLPTTRASWCWWSCPRTRGTG